MKRSIKIYGLAILLFALSGISSAQQPGKNDSTRKKFIAAATKIMVSAHYCTLITMDENGRPVGRILDAFDPDSNLVVWLGTTPGAEKCNR